jgi:hypothetical protein
MYLGGESPIDRQLFLIILTANVEAAALPEACYVVARIL